MTAKPLVSPPGSVLARAYYLPAQVAPAQAVDARAAVAEVNRVAARYGEAAKAGWAPLPDVLLFNQKKLGINSRELNVLLNMMAHYYTPGTMPFVRANVIAKRMGTNIRSVQRTISSLRKKKFITKTMGPKRQVIHDLTPLIEKLQPLARLRIVDRTARQAALNNGTQQQIAAG